MPIKRSMRALPVLGVCFMPLALHAQAQDTTMWEFDTWAGDMVVEVVARGLPAPMAIAFLPDGRLLVAERRTGTLLLVDPTSGTHAPVRGLEHVDTAGDGGTLDVEIHPDYERSGWIYLSYSVSSDSGSATALDRFRLDGDRATDRHTLFTARPWAELPEHHGGRIALRDGFVFLSIGDRQRHSDPQDLRAHNGKIIRLHDDGRIPEDNPFRVNTGALPEIWSRGHRNPQGLAFDPATGLLWSHEHGPMGGDEVQRIEPGLNYGWPVVTWGRDYDRTPIGDGRTSGPDFEQPDWYYVPSIAPSGMTFFQGNAVPRWQGSLFLGALAGRHLNRLVLRDGRVQHEERLFADRGWRIREVAQGPDGLLYLGVDGGMILRVRPATSANGS